MIQPKTGTAPLKDKTQLDIAINAVQNMADQSRIDAALDDGNSLSHADVVTILGWPRVPRNYQQETIDFMLSKVTQHPSGRVYGCLIGHAPGLGKTLIGSEASKQAIDSIRNDPTHPLYASANIKGRPLCTVIVCPPHLMQMWYNHIDKQHPNDTISLCTSDTKANRLAVLQPGFDWYIINYQAFRSADYLTAVKNLPIAVLVADESHNLKNRESKQAKAVVEISKLPTVCYKFLLSATPIKKEADDLWHQLYIIDPVAFSSEHRFLREFCMADYTQYGARNVRLNSYAAKKLMYVQPRETCATDPTKHRKAENRYTDWSWRPPKRVVEPAVPACECCAPYVFNVETQSTLIPPPPAPKVQQLTVNLADWLLDPKKTDTEEALESVAQFKRRKLFTVHSSYTPPEPTYSTTTSIAPGAYIMSFSYADVGQYLPPVIPATILVPMDTKAREVYQQVKNTYRASLPNLETIDLNSAIAALHALRVITCCDAKLDALKNIIDDTQTADDKPVHVVFCAYDITAEAVARHLGIPDDPKYISPHSKKPRPRYIAGHIAPDDRNEYAKQTAAMGYPIVATLPSMSEGVDVSYARYVDFFETDWTPGVMYQALSRVQRDRAIERDGAAPVQLSTQEHIVCSYILVENSIDEHVHSISQDRTRNARDILRVELATA